MKKEAARLMITQAKQPVAEFYFAHDHVKRPCFAGFRVRGGIQIMRNFPPIEGKDATDIAEMLRDDIITLRVEKSRCAYGYKRLRRVVALVEIDVMGQRENLSSDRSKIGMPRGRPRVTRQPAEARPSAGALPNVPPRSASRTGEQIPALAP